MSKESSNGEESVRKLQLLRAGSLRLAVIADEGVVVASRFDGAYYREQSVDT